MIHFYKQNLVENKRKVVELLTVPPYLDKGGKEDKDFLPTGLYGFMSQQGSERISVSAPAGPPLSQQPFAPSSTLVDSSTAPAAFSESHQGAHSPHGQVGQTPYQDLEVTINCQINLEQLQCLPVLYQRCHGDGVWL